MGLVAFMLGFGQKGQLNPIAIAKINSLVLFLEGLSNFQHWDLLKKGGRNSCR